MIGASTTAGGINFVSRVNSTGIGIVGECVSAGTPSFMYTYTLLLSSSEHRNTDRSRASSRARTAASVAGKDDEDDVERIVSIPKPMLIVDRMTVGR